MNVFTKQRITGWIIVLLVILNVFALATTWIIRPTRVQENPRPPVRDFLKEELHLTEEQAQQFEELRKQHFLQSKAITDEAHQLKRAMLDELFSSPPNLAKVEELTEEIGEKQEELEQLRFQHFLALKSLCQPEQVEKLRALIEEIVHPPMPPGSERPPGQSEPPMEFPPGSAPPGGSPRRESSQGLLEPPREAIQACSGKKQRDTCEFTAPHGTVTGTCRKIQNQLACVPEGASHDGGPSPDGQPREKH